MPIVMSAIFAVVLFKIKKNINLRRKDTSLEMKIYNLQVKTINKLRNTIIIVFCLAFFEFIYQLIEVFSAQHSNT